MSDEVPVTRTPSRRARLGLAGLAILLALIALLLGGWAIWQTKVLEQARDAEAAQVVRYDARLAAIERSDAAANNKQQALEQRLNDATSDNRATRDALQGIDQRARNLETAIGTLSDQQMGGRDSLLLDDAELLLRAGQQRYTLFHDAASALQAYTLAEQVLAQVQDPAFAPVRASVANERAALAAAMPPPRQQALDALDALRAQLPSLPLAAPEVGDSANSHPGIWSHLWHAFSGILRIERDESAPLPAADARFARELGELDLAQAQASLLTFDDAGYRAALQRVEATLAARFDDGSQDVQHARAEVLALLAAQPPSSPAPQLGGALAQLRDLRATHALQTIKPAPASTSGAAKKP